MDLLLALNVTIYGLGIVFLALLVLMVAIMLLGKIFSVATGKELSAVAATAPAATAAVAPEATPAAAASPPAEAGPAAPAEAVPAPLPGKVLSVAVKAGDRVRAGQELCAIEAMKMANSVKSPRDGVVAAVQVSAGEAVAFGTPLLLLTAAGGATAGAGPAASAAAPPAAAATAASPVTTAQPASLTLTLAGTRHAVDVQPEADGATVTMNGTRYRVQRDPGNASRLLVNGQPHAVEVKERTGNGATVAVDGVVERVDIVARAASPVTSFSLGYAGRAHQVELRAEDGAGSVVLDGTRYQLQQDRQRGLVLIDGKPHAVEVQERTGSRARVWIDGLLQEVELQAERAVPVAAPVAPTTPAAPTVTSVPRPAPPAGQGERVTAPLPGKVISIAVKPGDAVKVGDELCVIEAMKMGNSVRAQRAGVVREVAVAAGQAVAFGAPLLILD